MTGLPTWLDFVVPLSLGPNFCLDSGEMVSKISSISSGLEFMPVKVGVASDDRVYTVV